MPRLPSALAETADRRAAGPRVQYALYPSVCGCPSECSIEPDVAIVRIDGEWWLEVCATENGAEVDWT